MAKLANAADSKSAAHSGLAGSNPALATMNNATHIYSGYGCIANMKQLSTAPITKRFEKEKVQLLMLRYFDLIFLDKDGTIWITDSETWENKSEKIISE